MTDLSQQRCFQHAGREAAAVCTQCGRFFCRECVTEHDDRMICSGCLAKLAGSGSGVRRRLGVLLGASRLLLGLLLAWALFYYLGRALMRIPSSFHEGTVWERLVG